MILINGGKWYRPIKGQKMYWKSCQYAYKRVKDRSSRSCFHSETSNFWKKTRFLCQETIRVSVFRSSYPDFTRPYCFVYWWPVFFIYDSLKFGFWRYFWTRILLFGTRCYFSMLFPVLKKNWITDKIPVVVIYLFIHYFRCYYPFTLYFFSPKILEYYFVFKLQDVASRAFTVSFFFLGGLLRLDLWRQDETLYKIV